MSAISHWTRRTMLVVGGCILSGCISPTLPLPPPNEPNVEGPNAQGQVRLSGMVPPKSEVIAINSRTNAIGGEISDDDGAYDFTISAAVGDPMKIYYRQGTQASQIRHFVIRDPGGAGGEAGAPP